jgi:hypothetical protein
MTSPFDIAKTILTTKEDCYTTEELFNREYVPFMINRIMSNSERTVLFAEQMDKYSMMDKKLQYDFYLKGIPKTKGFQKMWTKKETDSIDDSTLIEYISTQMNCNSRRAKTTLDILGRETAIEHMNLKGGRVNK